MAELDHEILSEVQKRLTSLYQPHDIYLFGSYAMGTATAESDVDLFVVMPLGVFAGRQLAIEARRALKDVFHSRKLAFDLIIKSVDDFDRFKNHPGTLHYEVAKNGISILER